MDIPAQIIKVALQTENYWIIRSMMDNVSRELNSCNIPDWAIEALVYFCDNLPSEYVDPYEMDELLDGRLGNDFEKLDDGYKLNILTELMNIIVERDFWTSDEYYKSSAHRAAHILIKHMNGLKIYDQSYVGIGSSYYSSKDLAKEWRDKLLNFFHPVTGFQVAGQTIVIEGINIIYQRMIGEA